MSVSFIPKKINVGYQLRSDTYQNKLAYVIYFDEKNILRKEKSWNSWRNKDIPNDIFDNKLTEGFVLNTVVGGDRSNWGRDTYIRVYDPRGFEIEISIENLLTILKYNNSIKGKALEGKYCYSWSGSTLILLSENDPEYKINIENTNKKLNNEFLKPKDIKIGFSYKDKNNKELIYLGKHIYYSDYCRNKNKDKENYIFCNIENELFYKKLTINKYLFEETSNEIHPKYLEKLDLLNRISDFNIKNDKYTYKLDKEDFEYIKTLDDKTLSHSIYNFNFFYKNIDFRFNIDNKKIEVIEMKINNKYEWISSIYNYDKNLQKTIEEKFNKIKKTDDKFYEFEFNLKHRKLFELDYFIKNNIDLYLEYNVLQSKNLEINFYHMKDEEYMYFYNKASEKYKEINN